MKKLPVCLTGFYCIVCAFFGNAQVPVVDYAGDSIPAKYQLQFKEDNQAFFAYINPSMEEAARTYALLSAVDSGYIKNFNRDSLAKADAEQWNTTFRRKIEFIQQHPDSYASLFNFKQWILVSPRFSTDSLSNMFSRLGKDIRETPLGHSVATAIERKKALQINHEVPLFSFKTQKGQTIELSAFRKQKYVLLCFWASWCVPCVKNIPFLKKIDSVYRDKGLQLISVSSDRDEPNWLAALQKYNMPWLQTWDFPLYTNDLKLKELFQVYYIPQYFLIDKEGKLVYQNFFNKDTDDHDILQNVLRQVFD